MGDKKSLPNDDKELQEKSGKNVGKEDLGDGKLVRQFWALLEDYVTNKLEEKKKERQQEMFDLL